MNFQKIVLKRILYDKNQYLFYNTNQQLFDKLAKTIYNLIDKYFNKYNRLPEPETFLAKIQQQISKEKYQTLEAYIKSLEKISSDLRGY